MLTRREWIAAAPALLYAAGGLRAGCQTNAWRINPDNFSEVLAVLDKIKGYGYQGFETGFRNVQGQFANAAAARTEIEKRGLRFLGCHIFLLQYDAETSVAPADLIESAAKGAAALGAERLILSGASASGDGAKLKKKIRALEAIARRVRVHGLQLAYHNHDLEFRNSGHEIEAMLAGTERLRLIMDAGHAFRGGADVPAFLMRHAKRIDGMHLRDFMNGEQVPLGQGEVNLKAVAEAIRGANWQGWIINEEERLNDVKPGDAAVAPARAALKSVFGI
jgi:inosose dehydratase